MTLLYRTPNIKIDKYEFHATVESHRGGRPCRHFRWRKPGGMWRKLADFDEGHAPKLTELNMRFGTFRKHMVLAMESAA